MTVCHFCNDIAALKSLLGNNKLEVRIEIKHELEIRTEKEYHPQYPDEIVFPALERFVEGTWAKFAIQSTGFCHIEKEVSVHPHVGRKGCEEVDKIRSYIRFVMSELEKWGYQVADPVENLSEEKEERDSGEDIIEHSFTISKRLLSFTL